MQKKTKLHALYNYGESEVIFRISVDVWMVGRVDVWLGDIIVDWIELNDLSKFVVYSDEDELDLSN